MRKKQKHLTELYQAYEHYREHGGKLDLILEVLSESFGVSKRSLYRWLREVKGYGR